MRPNRKSNNIRGLQEKEGNVSSIPMNFYKNQKMFVDTTLKT